MEFSAVAVTAATAARNHLTMATELDRRGLRKSCAEPTSAAGFRGCRVCGVYRLYRVDGMCRVSRVYGDFRVNRV